MGKNRHKRTIRGRNSAPDPAPARCWSWPLPPREVVTYAAIFLFALLLRLYFISNAEWFARSDTRDFHEYALNLLRGEGFVNYWNEAPFREGFVSRQVHSVGYPLFLAGVYALTGFDKDVYARSYMANMPLGAHPLPAQGFNPHHAMLANIALELITMWALIVIARRYFGFGVAVVVQMLYALYVTWTPQLISETYFICLFVSALALLVTNSEFERPRRTVAFALVAMLAVMAKPMAIILYTFVGLWVLCRPSWSRIRRAVLIGLPLVLFISVMFWRSHHYYGQMFLSSTGAQHIATHNYEFNYEEEHVRLWSDLGRAPNEAEWMNYFKALKKQADREDPMRALRLYGLNFVQMFSWEPDWHMHWLWQANFHRHPDVADLHRMLFRLSLLWYPLGVIGLLFFARRARIPAVTIVLFFVLHAAVSHGHHRYMAPVNVLFMLFAGAALYHAGRWIKNEFTATDDDSPLEPASSPANNRAQ